MFLFIIREKTSNHIIQEKFQYSSAIISQVFHKISTSLLYLHAETVNLFTKDDALHLQIIDNIKYFSYFQNCLSILDSTYILAHIPAINSIAY